MHTKNLESNLALLKAAFPRVFDSLMGSDGGSSGSPVSPTWSGMDDFQPFWTQRRIFEAVAAQTRRTGFCAVTGRSLTSQ